MKIEQSIGTSEHSANQFTIAATGKAFRILSDGLYADKIKAIIRELSCNARDSHVAAGNDGPWDLHLPTQDEPWFEVRDYGTGMSHEQITDIYTRYFASTKTSSNDYVGQLGLGSKSPFSYTREFGVESRHGGKTLRYRMFFDDTDTPRVEQISEGMANDTGLAVRFPVHSNHDRWAEKAGQVLSWFDSKPRLTGGRCGMATPEVRWQGDGWRIFSTDGRGDHAMAIMGGVCYPIAYDSIPGIGDAANNLCRIGIAIDFAIGELDVAASREGLSYDPRTCANITARLDSVIAEITAMFQDSVGKQPTEWMARRTWREWINGNSYYLRMVLDGIKPTWRGIEISSATKAISFSDIYAQGDTGIKLWPYGYKSNSRPSSINLRCDEQTIVVFDDLDKGGIGRARFRHLSTNSKQVTVMFSPSSTMGWDALRDAIGGPDVVMASTLPKPPAARGQSQANQVEAYVLRDYSDGRNAWKAADADELDTSKGTIYWVEMRGWDVLAQGPYAVGAHTARTMAQSAKTLGIISQDARVVGLRQRHAKKMRGARGWVNLVDHVRLQAVELSMTASVLQDISDTKNLRGSIEEHWSNTGGIRMVLNSAPQEWIDGLRDGDSVMRRVHGMYLQRGNSNGRRVDAIESLMAHFDIKVELPKPTMDFDELMLMAVERYAMLKHMQARWNDSVAEDIRRYVDTVDMNYTWEVLSREA